tara:strand:+ start:471 stop:629 length:159 start_codon:yes stop_codon:yes gene_type:complete
MDGIIVGETIAAAVLRKLRLFSIVFKSLSEALTPGTTELRGWILPPPPTDSE